MTIHTFTVTVGTPDEISADQIKDHLLRLLSVGQDDATDAQDDDDLSDEHLAEAKQAANLEIAIETKP